MRTPKGVDFLLSAAWGRVGRGGWHPHAWHKSMPLWVGNLARRSGELAKVLGEWVK